MPLPRIRTNGAGRAPIIPIAAPNEQLELFPGQGVNLSILRKEQAALAETHWAAATRRGYAFDLVDYRAWCESAHRVAVPASSDTVQLYLIACHQRGKALATIARQLAAIAAEHHRLGHRSPVDDDVRTVVKGLGRKMGHASPGAKVALSVDDLVAIVAQLPADEVGARDRAVLVLGFVSGLRRSELSALNLSDVRIVPEGVILRIKRSKTDQAGVGREIGVNRGEVAAVCPVRVLQAWLAVRGSLEAGKGDGPLFLAREVGGKVWAPRRLLAATVAGIVQRSVKAIGLDPAAYGGHSLRAGCATAGSANGASDLSIMLRTGHKSSAMMGRYVRHGSLFASDPLRGALEAASKRRGGV